MKSGAEAVGLRMEVVRNRRALGWQMQGFRTQMGYGCRIGAVRRKSGAEPEQFEVKPVQNRRARDSRGKDLGHRCRIGAARRKSGAEPE